jgi:DHA1 family tetracycline resistance protein-like MFS transporter
MTDINRRQAGANFILLTVLLDALSIGVIVPVLPDLLKELGASGTSSAWAMGALQGSFALAQFLFAAWLGAWSDHVGRKPVLLMGLFALALCFLAGAWTDSLMVLLAFRAFSGAACANMAVANAYVADVTPPDQMPAQYGKLGAVFGVGFILGPALGGLVGEGHSRWPFLLAASLSGISLLYGWLVLPESLPPEKRRPWRAVSPWGALAQLRGMGALSPLLWVIGAVMLAQAAVETFWLLYTTFRFGWGPRDNGLSLLVMGVAAALAQVVLLPRLQGRMSSQQMVQAGLWSFVACLVAWGLAHQGWMMWAVAVANALGYLVMPAAQSVIAAQVPDDRKGETMGALSALASVMAVLGPLMASPVLAWVMDGSPQAWTAGAPFFCLAVVLAGVAWHHRRSMSTTPQGIGLDQAPNP